VTGVACPRVHHESWWFVEDYQGTVLEDYFERKLLRLNVFIRFDTGFNANTLSPKHLVTCPQHTSVDLHFACLDPAL
jgi:hypothetical protein